MSWPFVTLGSLIEDEKSGASLKRDEFTSTGASVVPKKAISDSADLLEETLVFTSERKFAQSKGAHISRSHLITTLRNLNPDGSTLGLICRHNISGSVMLAQGMHAFRLKEGVHPDYICYASRQSTFRAAIQRAKVGSTQVHIRARELKEIKIPLPPLPEQKRIAAVLDKADAIRRKRQQTIKLADEFLRSVFLDMFGDPVTNPKGWEVRELGTGLMNIKSGWSANGADHPCVSGQLGVLKISAVTSGMYKPWENKCVPPESVPPGKKLIFPEKGDVMFSRANTRELVAAACIVTEHRDDVFLPDKLWLIELDQRLLLPEFFAFLLKNPRFRRELCSQATGTSGSMLNISKEKFQSTPAIYPDIATQGLFGKIFWGVEGLAKKFNSSEESLGGSFDSLTQAAFNGRL